MSKYCSLGMCLFRTELIKFYNIQFEDYADATNMVFLFKYLSFSKKINILKSVTYTLSKHYNKSKNISKEVFDKIDLILTDEKNNFCKSGKHIEIKLEYYYMKLHSLKSITNFETRVDMYFNSFNEILVIKVLSINQLLKKIIVILIYLLYFVFLFV
ncbi:MAG: hypothetical protein RR623_05670 [Bacilli bacterium]